MVKYSFDNSSKSFFNGLKGDIDAYFRNSNIHPAGNRRLYFKSILQVLLSASLYCTLVFFTPPAWVSIILCIILGFNLAVIGFNVMHEGGHHAFSKYSWVNNFSSYFLNVLGGISYFWKIKHNVNHHTYTNVEGMDSDIDVKPFMRLHEGQPWKPYHQYQYLYWIPLYGISYLAWVFYEDFVKYFTSKVSPNSDVKKLPAREHFVFWFTKMMYITIYGVVPIIMVGFLPWLIGFLIIAFVCGLTTSIVFQLAHVVQGTQFHIPADHASGEKIEWAVHQVISTANFGTSSRTLHWLLGGLNFQIEHHLFPRVSHIHYPVISRYVKRACKDAGVGYHEYKSMLAAFISHLVYLKKLGATQCSTSS
jgi:linoleoyl-CoA desaturase